MSEENKDNSGNQHEGGPDDHKVHQAKSKKHLDDMIEEWPGLSVVDYWTPSWRPFHQMDRMFERMSRDFDPDI